MLSWEIIFICLKNNYILTLNVKITNTGKEKANAPREVTMQGVLYIEDQRKTKIWKRKKEKNIFKKNAEGKMLSKMWLKE